jgi:hypothetical protein
MACARNRDWESGARGRLYHRFFSEPIGQETLYGFVWDPRVFGEGFLSPPEGTPDINYDTSGQAGGTWFVRGFKCPVRIRYLRDGVEAEEILGFANGWELEIELGASLSVNTFTARGH